MRAVDLESCVDPLGHRSPLCDGDNHNQPLLLYERHIMIILGSMISTRGTQSVGGSNPPRSASIKKSRRVPSIGWFSEMGRLRSVFPGSNADTGGKRCRCGTCKLHMCSLS
ncbi:hypothetical protein K443DRAFT_544139 [Laccaria amethystina LaAM-08-1]|uniref:Uncharacterized protein n=1 Tax=Laccaria amethystina LaAM-08-1 TaxID=1095629 RepID=A0A0C9XWN7_9AGAR|nr:hypothetical protein K443DRAFT_544139 [Laccaria amethystina LaAM-08-1]